MVWPAIIAGGAGIAGSVLGKLFADEQADDAWDRTSSAYARRYQTTMADMKAAGLNPILAAGSGGFNVGSGPVATMANLPKTEVASAYESYQKGQLASEQAKTEQVNQLKKMAELKTEIQNKYLARAKTGEATASEKAHLAKMQNLWQQIHKFRDEQGVLKVEKDQANQVLKQLIYSLNELRTISKVYSDSTGQMVQYINQIREALGIKVGVGVGKAF